MVQETITLTAEKRRTLFVLNCKLFTELTGQPVRPQDFEAMYNTSDETLLMYNLYLIKELCKRV
jgi:hypothetical protein